MRATSAPAAWTEVRLADVPDLPTRQEMVRWAEAEASGRFMPFKRRDALGRASWGIEFELPEDAQAFRGRWARVRAPEPADA
jgi:hypothetical protein